MARGSTKEFSEYSHNAGLGKFNNDTDTFKWCFIHENMPTIDLNSNTITRRDDFSLVADSGTYVGGTLMTGQTWTRTDNVSSLTFDDIILTDHPSNPDIASILIYNDTSVDKDAFLVIDVTIDGSTLVVTRAGLTYVVNVDGIMTKTVD